MNTEIRELTVDETMMVSGGGEKNPHIEIRLPGQVLVQLNPKQGVWAVWLGGKLYATEEGPA